MATARRTTTPATMTSILHLLVIVVVISLLVEIGVTGGSRRRCGRRPHGHAGKGGLVATMSVVSWCIHRHPHLLLLGLLRLLRELEGIVDVGGTTSHATAGRESVDLA